MTHSGGILASWQQYDLTIPRASDYEGQGWSGYSPPNNWPSDNPPEALWLFETGALYEDSVNDNDWGQRSRTRSLWGEFRVLPFFVRRRFR